MKDKTIGWIGTGLMRNPMVKHIRNAGYTVNVNNRSKQKAEDLFRHHIDAAINKETGAAIQK